MPYDADMLRRLPCVLISAFLVCACSAPTDETPVDPVPSTTTTAPGELALAILRGGAAGGLTVEIDHSQGRAPSDMAARSGLMPILKGAGLAEDLEIVVDTAIPAAEEAHRYTIEEIEALEAEHRQHLFSEDAASIYVLFLDGQLYDDTDTLKTLGLAYGGSSVALFKDSIATYAEALSGEIPREEARALLQPLTETTNLLHELGHILGLVDNGLAMVQDHVDPDNPHHDVDERCIMHWLNHSEDMVGQLVRRIRDGENSVRTFCRACQKDIREARRTLVEGAESP